MFSWRLLTKCLIEIDHYQGCPYCTCTRTFAFESVIPQCLLLSLSLLQDVIFSFKFTLYATKELFPISSLLPIPAFVSLRRGLRREPGALWFQWRCWDSWWWQHCLCFLWPGLDPKVFTTEPLS